MCLVHNASDGVTLFKAKGLDHVVEVFSTVGPDAAIGADHVAAVTEVFVVKRITFFLYDLLVAHAKRNPLRDIGFDAVLEHRHLRSDMRLHQCHLVLFVFFAYDFIRRIQPYGGGLELG